MARGILTSTAASTAALLLGAALLLAAAPARARATDFTVKGVNGKWSGKNIGLRTFKGKVIYMTFWATWCTPCLTELKHLRKFYTKHKGAGLVVIAVSIDEPITCPKVLPTVKRYKLPFPVVIDSSGSIVRLYNPKRTSPYSLLFSRKRKIVKRRSSFQISDLPAIKREILAELKKK